MHLLELGAGLMMSPGMGDGRNSSKRRTLPGKAAFTPVRVDGIQKQRILGARLSHHGSFRVEIGKKRIGNMILVLFVLSILPTDVWAIQVVVPETERSTALFASVILRCDYSTSANPQDVLVTWKYKSFCKDPVLDYYSTAYQAALQLGQDPANDCPDRQRTVRTVVQKRGTGEAMLGSEYRERKISIQNKADLVINEVMWWDNGVYFCSIDAPGDTTGDSDRELKLIVYHWLTVLFIILGALALILLFCVCCCQCCPQKCCCYVRCPCCPQTCCCPEKLVMQHRMIREAQKAMAPWMHGQPIYAPIGSHSSQGQPILYSGSFSDKPSKHNFAMGPMGPSPLPLLQHQPPPPLPHHRIHNNGSMHGGNNQMLDFLENQVRGMEMSGPPMHPAGQAYQPSQVYQPFPQPQPQPQPGPQGVSFTAGPPSMISALDEMGVRGVERTVITLPPIVQRGPSFSRRGTGGGGGSRGAPRISNQSSGSSNRTSGGGSRYPDNRRQRDSSPRRGILRSYSDESDWEERRGGGGARWAGRDSSRRRSGGGSGPRSRSRDDLMDQLRRSAPRRDRSYSPPTRRKGSWSSEEEDSQRGGGRGRGGRGGDSAMGKSWAEKPPSYFSIDVQPGGGRRNYDHLSERSSRSGTSVVI